MSRISLFNSPFLLGFDQFERVLEQVAKSPAEGYPPYNIEQHPDGELKITLAVAGFTVDQLSVELRDNQLVILGRQEDDQQRTYLHRGIAARQFQRTFVLAAGIEVLGADLSSGLLHVQLRQPLPEQRTRTIEIRDLGIDSPG